MIRRVLAAALAAAALLVAPTAAGAETATLDPDGPGGWVVDPHGGLHPFGGAPAVHGTGWWPGRDLARGVAADDDGPGGWVVDAQGGLHPFGGAPPVAGSGWWPGRDLARGVVADPQGPGGWVVDAHGGLHPFGGAPPVSGSGWWPGHDVARGVLAHPDGGGWVLDLAGRRYPFGGAPTVDEPPLWPPRRTVTYEVRTTGAVRSTADELATAAAAAYADPRGWLAAGIAFERVESGGDFTLWLAAPDRMESFSRVCDAFYSCRVGRNVVINDDRFTGGSPFWPGPVEAYRALVVNHETGHWLGLGHRGCPGPGQPAPVMQQQSKGLGGCAPNPWPTATELAAVR